MAQRIWPLAGMRRLTGLVLWGCWLPQLALAATAPVPDTPLVQTSLGAVKGTLANGAQVYQGLPFAAPPVGVLRWQAPQAPLAWEGVRDGTRQPVPCLQVKNDLAKTSSEDCLYLNVYVPDDAGDEKLPVMVWLHGGGFLTGSAFPYNLSTFARKTRTVVVSAEYRVGVFGTFRLPGSPAGTPANFGLMDQQAALRWVKKEISAFGGDPGRVTINGQSAGGASVCMHIQMPSSAGLFHRGIIQSGLCRPVSSPSTAMLEAGSARLAEGMGCPSGPTQADCMRSKAGAEVLAAAQPGGPLTETGLVWSPTVDGVTLLNDTATRLREGPLNKVPLIAGTNRDESRYYIANDYHLRNFTPVTASQFDAGLLKAANGDAAFAAQLKQVYAMRLYGTRDKALAAVGTDVMFACGALDDIEALSRHMPVYQYEFTEAHTPGVINPFMAMGAFHSVQLRYEFQVKLIGPMFNWPLNRAQQQLGDRMNAYFGQLAATGNPNLPGLPYWPGYSFTEPNSVALDSQGITTFSGADFNTRHHCDLWKGRLF
jgi:para-nitrobenzyl esterase